MNNIGLLKSGLFFRYAIDYEQTDPTQRFQVDPISGEVTLRNELDRETEHIHIVDIIAIDKGTNE